MDCVCLAQDHLLQKRLNSVQHYIQNAAYGRDKKQKIKLVAFK